MCLQHNILCFVPKNESKKSSHTSQKYEIDYILHMKKKELTYFPWSDLLNWYKVHGRHHLPWRQYEQESRIQNIESKT